jgi:hypothetical protein
VAAAATTTRTSKVIHYRVITAPLLLQDRMGNSLPNNKVAILHSSTEEEDHRDISLNNETFHRIHTRAVHRKASSHHFRANGEVLNKDTHHNNRVTRQGSRDHMDQVLVNRAILRISKAVHRNVNTAVHHQEGKNSERDRAKIPLNTLDGEADIR